MRSPLRSNPSIERTSYSRLRLLPLVVEAAQALKILQQANADAAAWWRTNAPHMLVAGRCFLFDESCGQVVTS
jgi:hypothetical protein